MPKPAREQGDIRARQSISSLLTRGLRRLAKNSLVDFFAHPLPFRV
jgi:hypothetical protein